MNIISKEMEFLYTPQAKNIENEMNLEAIKKMEFLTLTALILEL